jgi:hypothetical protein
VLLPACPAGRDKITAGVVAGERVAAPDEAGFVVMRKPPMDGPSQLVRSADGRGSNSQRVNPRGSFPWVRLALKVGRRLRQERQWFLAHLPVILLLAVRSFIDVA